MDTASISALAAVGGSAVGALASFLTTWLTLSGQQRAQALTHAMARKETLYGEFIDEASKLFTDALTHELDDVSKFVRLYALSNKLRLFAPAAVLEQMDKVTSRIPEIYRRPNLDLRTAGNQPAMDILRDFSEACRKDLHVQAKSRRAATARLDR